MRAVDCGDGELEWQRERQSHREPTSLHTQKKQPESSDVPAPHQTLVSFESFSICAPHISYAPLHMHPRARAPTSSININITCAVSYTSVVNMVNPSA